MARPQKCRCICSMPKTSMFFPADGDGSAGCVVLGLDEYEVIRLLDLEHFSQERCAKRMNIARTTVTRMYDTAREKIAEALVGGKRLVIDGGNIMVCKRMKPECRNEPHCCHRDAAPADTQRTDPKNECKGEGR